MMTEKSEQHSLTQADRDWLDFILKMGSQFERDMLSALFIPEPLLRDIYERVRDLNNAGIPVDGKSLVRALRLPGEAPSGEG